MSSLVTIQFHDDTLYAVEDGDSVYVAITPICQRLGVDPQKQRSRIAEDPILSEGVCRAVYPSAGGAQESAGLRLDLLHGWLFTINDKLIRDPETRDRVLLYKRECYAALHRHFFGRRAERLPHGTDTSAVTPEGLSVATAVALVKEARMTFGNRQAAGLWHRLGLPAVEGMVDPAQGDLLLTAPAPAAR